MNLSKIQSPSFRRPPSTLAFRRRATDHKSVGVGRQGVLSRVDPSASMHRSSRRFGSDRRIEGSGLYGAGTAPSSPVSAVAIGTEPADTTDAEVDAFRGPTSMDAADFEPTDAGRRRRTPSGTRPRLPFHHRPDPVIMTCWRGPSIPAVQRRRREPIFPSVPAG